MVNDLVRLVKLGIIVVSDIKDESVRTQVEYELNK